MDRFSKNPEITANPEVKALLDAGHIVVIDKWEPSTGNKDITMLCLMAYVDGIRSNSVSNLKASLMGWTRSTERCIESVNAELVTELEIGTSFTDYVKDKVGMTPAIQITDGTTDTFKDDTSFHDSWQRATKDGEVLVDTTTGEEVYRKKEIVSESECNHTVISVTPQSSFEEKSKAVSAKLLLNDKITP